MTRLQAVGFWAGLVLAFAVFAGYFLVSLYQYHHYGCLPWERCS
jgi:hypothetical protein